MKNIKKNKLLVLFLILLTIFVAFSVKLIIIFTESDEVAFYGTRLEGIDKVKIDDNAITKKVSDKIGPDIISATARTQGRIVNLMITIKGNISRDTAKEDAQRAIEEFSEDERNYYDIQIFINKTEEAEDSKQFPIIGYKHHTRSDIAWTKDRTGE